MRTEPTIVVQLIHIQGPLKGQIQEFSSPSISIGRHPSCDLQFPKDLSIISRKHAEIVREGNRFKLIDQSTNGTFVNGKQITEAYLKDGDVIMFSADGPKVSFLAEISEAQPGRDIPEPAVPAEPPIMPVEPVKPPREQAAPEPPRQQAPPASPPPRKEAPISQDIPVQKVQAPLIVQYGPTLNSFKELPVNLGQGPGNNLIISHPSIMDRHAQIFFAQGQYWIKDLTGKKSIAINGRPIEAQAPMNAHDVIALSPQGPKFRFLGEGRLAEYDEPVQEPQKPMHSEPEGRPTPQDAKRSKGIKSFKDIFKK
ncbi:MAG: FHA domain-containing protein [Desulfomonilia bacterium]